MVFMPTLEVKTRNKNENLNQIRKTGFIPAVFYGRKQESTDILVKTTEFNKVLAQAGESTVVTLKGDFGTHDAMIHEVDRDPITGVTRHADFYVIEKDKKIKVHVPVEFEGVSPAVKELGGILVKVVHEIEIEALPGNLPHAIHVDISALVDFDSNISAGDLKLPSGVTLAIKPEEIIASIAKPKEEEENTAPIDISSIEVEKKGKDAKEGADEAVA
ncbi:MAG: large subunit ribosomal protein [Patescibacteria group bacterium]|jgi:large subunit ribosomal protein L25|nr:large subunit ribosomal protein [Patescibacteria group bacterium]